MDERRIREAFERMTPSEEAKGRMLGNILAHGVAHDDGLAAIGAQTKAPPRRAGLRLVRRIALGMAACLALIVGAGMLTRPHAATDAARTSDALMSSAPSKTSDNASKEPQAERSDAAQTNDMAASETRGGASKAPDNTSFPVSIEFEGRSYQRSDEALSEDGVESVREPLAEIDNPNAAPGSQSTLLVYSLVDSDKTEAVGVSGPGREQFCRYTASAD